MNSQQSQKDIAKNDLQAYLSETDEETEKTTEETTEKTTEKETEKKTKKKTEKQTEKQTERQTVAIKKKTPAATRAPRVNHTVKSCDVVGYIDASEGTIQGYTADYILKDGSKTTVRSSLGDHWHIRSSSYVESHGSTYYECYDSDDGDYYGWVDGNYIVFEDPDAYDDDDDNAGTYGEINASAGTVSGYSSSYVVNGGSRSTVRDSLGDGWHIRVNDVYNSYGITWYECYDSDDGDYYGWVDSRYVTLY